jgi:hypothetical protein
MEVLTVKRSEMLEEIIERLKEMDSNDLAIVLVFLNNL